MMLLRQLTNRTMTFNVRHIVQCVIQRRCNDQTRFVHWDRRIIKAARFARCVHDWFPALLRKHVFGNIVSGPSERRCKTCALTDCEDVDSPLGGPVATVCAGGTIRNDVICQFTQRVNIRTHVAVILSSYELVKIAPGKTAGTDAALNVKKRTCVCVSVRTSAFASINGFSRKFSPTFLPMMGRFAPTICC